MAINGNNINNINALSSPRLSAPSSNRSSRRPSHNITDLNTMESADASVPMRHPRPLTAAELHLELEREQEAVVNRLTRELSALRAQHSASVASNASQSSAVSNTPISDAALGLTHPTPTRQHRSSSTASSRSANTPSTASQSQQSTAPLAGVSQASFDRAAAVGQSAPPPPTTATGGGSISRQPSIRSASGTSTPAVLHRASVTGAMSSTSQAGSFAQPSLAASNPASPYTTPSSSSTDAALVARQELDVVKAENEALRQRVKALERALRSRRGSTQSEHREPSLSRPSVGAWAAAASGTAGTSVAGPRERSESQSTTASSRRPEMLDREDSIRVGESAATVGLGLRQSERG